MKRITYIVLSFLVVLHAAAQQDKKDSIFAQDVNIIREYIPVIKDAGKINTLPKVERTETIEKSNVAYSTWTSPIATYFNLQTLPSATLKRMRQPQNFREGYAKIGAGNYTSFLGDFYVPILKAKDYRLDFLANHLSTFGKVKLDNESKARAKNMENAAQLSFNKNFYSVDLFSEIKFERHDFNYYGLDNINSINHYTLSTGNVLPGNNLALDKDAHNMLDMAIKIASRPKTNGINYATSIGYKLTNTMTHLSENHIETKGFVSANWDIDELGIHLSLDNLFYNNPASTDILFGNVIDQLDSYSIFGLKPFYKFRREVWNLQVGIKTFFSFNKGKAVCITPDVAGDVALVKDIFYLYGGVTGDCTTNSMRSIFNENQYVRPDVHIDQTYTPIDAFAGTKIKIFDYMVFNAFLGYKFINNQYFFVNHLVDTPNNYLYDNTFDVVIDEARVFNAGASITYNRNQILSILLKGVYNNWNVTDQAYAWHKPAWQLDVDVSYKINKDIKVSANAFALGKRYARGYMNEAVKLKPIFDLSFSGTYEYTSWLSFFLNVNNVFAQNYQHWYGYNSHRFNALAGAMFSF